MKWAPLILLVPALTVGCGRSQSPLPRVDAEVRDRAMSAKDALFTELSTRLMSTMGQQGPAAAIAVCSDEAAEIAAKVSKEQGVQIGRTSFKLRNPQNAPPTWATSLVEQRVEQSTFVNAGNDKIGALIPIKLKAQCLMCHGAKENLSPDVAQELAKRYPHDEATGFAEGDLRGWFWVEVDQ